MDASFSTCYNRIMLNAIRKWFWRVKLTLINQEIEDVLDDMQEALHQRQLGTHQALADFHRELASEAIDLRIKLEFPNIER